MDLSLQFSLRDDEMNLTYSGSNITETMGSNADGRTATSATSEVTETIDTDVSDSNKTGMLLLANLSTTAAETIDVGFATGVHVITLAARDDGINWALLPLKGDTTAIFHESASGTPRLFWKVWERE